MFDQEKVIAIFEKRIKAQEQLIINTAHKFDDESLDQFYAKVSRRIRNVCVGVGHAQDIPGINIICPYRNGTQTEWNGYIVSRNAVDQLDNVYVRRAI